MGKINAYDKIMIENQKKKKKIWKSKKSFLHKSPSNRWFKNIIHSLLSEVDARGSADIIYRQ